MAGSGATMEKKMSIKIMIDTKANKVVFAEAGKEFVDYIINILSLPLSTVCKLVNPIGEVGCLGDLYRSIESLDTKYFENTQNKDTILKPRTGVVPLLSLNEAPCTVSQYICWNHKYISDFQGTVCRNCYYGMPEQRFNYVAPKDPKKYVNGLVNYMVMDNLEFSPMSASLIKLYVKDFDSLMEKEVQVGFQEGLAMLKASLETKSVLTTVFLEEKVKPGVEVSLKSER